MNLQLHIEQLRSGRWALFYPDGTRFDHESYATRGWATRRYNEWMKWARTVP